MKFLRWMNRQLWSSPTHSATNNNSNNNNMCINTAEGNERQSAPTTSTLLDEGGLLAIGTLGARLDLEHHPLETGANCLFDYDDLHITTNEIANILTPPRAKLSVYINSSSISGNDSSSCSNNITKSDAEKGTPICDPIGTPSQLSSELSMKKKLNKMSLAQKIFGSYKNNGSSKKNTPAATENTNDMEPKWKLFRKKSRELIRSPAEMKKFEGTMSNRSSTSSDTSSSSSDRRKSSGSDSSSSSYYNNQTHKSVGSKRKSGSNNKNSTTSDNMAYCDTAVATGCQPSANEIERWIRTDHDYVVLELE